MTVPSGPAFGRKAMPGITKDPQPMIQPRLNAKMPNEDSLFFLSIVCLLFTSAEHLFSNLPFGGPLEKNGVLIQHKYQNPKKEFQFFVNNAVE